MQILNAFFRLIRWRNLLIVAFTQLLIWCCVIQPMKSWNTALPFLNGWHITLLILSTVFIAAAGYIINDYFDVKIDVINRPQKVIVDVYISRKAAILWHSALNIAGLLLAAYLARKIGNYWVLSVQVLTTLLLWFYTTAWKRQFVIGNIIVALLTACAIMLLLLFEPSLKPFLSFQFFIQQAGRLIVNPAGVIAVYAFFAFMLTWMREIVKDMEDFKGDAEDGCITMPIKMGLQRSSYFVSFLGILTIVPLVIVAIKLLTGDWALLGMYLLLVLVLPIVIVIAQLHRKATTTHYARYSKYLKMIMVAGVASLIVYFILQYI
jgi:4-hydroxybenzoate polyprenyltransferase